MYVRCETVTVTTDASGDATEYSSVLNGQLYLISYEKGDYDADPDFAITGESTAQGIWTENDVDATTVRVPVQAAHNVTGGAVMNQYRPLVLSERVEIVISGGGDTKSGIFRIYTA